MDRHLSPAETASRFGISIKALRLYEQRGLLTPHRTRNGSTGAAWRAYGPDQIARLHQILALKRRGLSLARIGALLDSADALDPILALQERTLSRDGQRISLALTLVKAARAKLASGQALSIDDLANLTKETVMTSIPSPQEIEALFAPVAAKHFTPEERLLLAERRQAHLAEFIAVRAEAEAALAAGDPASQAARKAAERYRAVGRAMANGDKAFLLKLKAFREEALADPKLSSLMALSPELDAFMQKAMTYLD